jgi:hypothetical protein
MANDKPPVPKGEKGYQSGATTWWDTPADVEDVDALIWPRSVDTYDTMRRQDPQIGQALQALMLPILRTSWRVEPNGAPTAVVEHVADDLGLPIVGKPNRKIARTANRFNWGEHLRLALLSRTFGHAFFEQVYEVRRDGPNGELRVHIKKLAYRPPRTIAKVDVAPDGGLVAIHQQPAPGFRAVGPSRDIEIGVERLVAYVNNREGGNWLGQSVLRPAYKSWVLKDRLLRIQTQTIDRNGMGLPVYYAATPPATVTDDAEWLRRVQADIDDGYDIATGVRAGESAGVSLPPGADLKLLGVEGTLPDADKPIRLHNEEIMKAVLGNFLNLGGDNSTGSYALGDTFAEFFTLSLQAHAIDIAETANAHIVEDLVDLNYGTDTPAPRIVFDEIGTRHQVTAQALYQLVQVGALVMDDTLEEYIRTTYELPAIDAATRRKPTATTNAPTEPTEPTTDPPTDPSTGLPPADPAADDAAAREGGHFRGGLR